MALTLVRAPASEAADNVLRAWDRGRAVLVTNPAAPRAELDRLVESLRPDAEVAPEVAAVVATSGTTGEPRGVELTWSGLLAMAEAVTASVGASAGGDRWLCCLPLHHVGGLAVVARSWATGIPLRVLDSFDVTAFDLSTLDAALRAPRPPTLVSLVPTMLRRLQRAGINLGSFRRILVGGAPVLEPLPPNATVTYGLTETWGGVVHAGRPLAGVDLRLGSGGEILVRGPMVMAGYRFRPRDTAAALDGDGWLRTGDVGHFDPEGLLSVVGRRRELIISGGVNVSPSEVEQALASHPGVADVCVAGVPDEEWGERVVAFLVPVDPATPPDLAGLRAFAADRLSAAKLPREAIVVDTIPRTTSGKPLRRLLLRSATHE